MDRNSRNNFLNYWENHNRPKSVLRQMGEEKNSRLITRLWGQDTMFHESHGRLIKTPVVCSGYMEASMICDLY